ncbi:DICT sensory domain-containing protein [Rhodococcus sp. SGAir0479]|uniref:DICT sensory domain-containing protein n=1 Tax=Rhodococcus sp. SGAir0479 TaxID=2567884 RepID=UPI0010CD5530|nr:DICT sensory domain-containing protein [Rhodococcus sp. SGAir0479]QCQ93523.1 EAL domain-containing protein [Rhodococcus sp. SGAir0479]
MPEPFAPVCRLVDGAVVALTWTGADLPGPAPDLPVLAPLGFVGAPAAASRVTVVTPQWLSEDPAGVLRLVDAARSAGDLIAVGGVGSHARAVGWLPLLQPDVIVVSRDYFSATSGEPGLARAQAVSAAVERSNAVVVAEGIDTEDDRLHALTLGVHHGTGALFGAPNRAGDGWAHRARGTLLDGPTWHIDPEPAASTPFSIVSRGRECVRSFKSLLVEMSTALEAQACTAGPDAVVVGTFQRAAHYTAATERRWAQLADGAASVHAYGEGFERGVRAGVLRRPLAAGDPVLDEWNVIVVGPHFACALSALDLHRGIGEPRREFEYVVSYERDTVVRAARSVLARG